jgi:hypothetical protein
MAASSSVSSVLISNRDATPKVLTDAYVSGGELSSSEGYVQSNGSLDTSGTLYKILTIPSNARVHQLLMTAGSFGSGGAFDVGVYWPTYIPVGAGLTAASASTAIASQFFASNLAVSNSTSEHTDITNSSGTNTIQNQELPIWSAIGLANDPMIDLDIVITVHTVIAAQGYVGLKCVYQKDG